MNYCNCKIFLLIIIMPDFLRKTFHLDLTAGVRDGLTLGLFDLASGLRLHAIEALWEGVDTAGVLVLLAFPLRHSVVPRSPIEKSERLLEAQVELAHEAVLDRTNLAQNLLDRRPVGREIDARTRRKRKDRHAVVGPELVEEAGHRLGGEMDGAELAAIDHDHHPATFGPGRFS